MKLSALIASSGIAIDVPASVADFDVLALTSDSRKAGAGSVFVAIDGARRRGIEFAAQVEASGAIAIVASEAADVPIPTLIVDDPRAALGALASAFHGHPSRAIEVIAVTGTNGKTTVANLVAQLLVAAGTKAAAIGTVGLVTPDGIEPAALTTPECEQLHAILADLRERGIGHVAIEASSHALDQNRLAGVRIAAAAWTNLSRDHLDYHGDETSYAAAKARLFTDLLDGRPGFVNGDDAHCRAMIDAGLATGWSAAGDADSDHQLAGVRAGRDGVQVILHSPDRAPLELTAPLLGDYNVHNLAAAALLCRAMGLSDAAIASASRSLRAPAGRMEVVPTDIGSVVVVDYAHTPDALDKSLQVARSLVAPGGRLVVTFGCGGDRDKGKRAPMGQVAARHADLVLVTSDNPRSEDPDAIVADIAAGLLSAGAVELDRLAPSRLSALADRTGFLREPERGFAIRRCIGVLQPGDVLVIAGKGHETTQTIGGEVRAFSDVAVATGWLERHRRNGSGMRMTDPPSGPTSFAFDGPTALRECGGSLIIGGRETGSLSTDSRAIVDDSLFVALRGERFDGNEFVGQVIDAGAAGVVCSEGQGSAHLAAARAARAWVLETPDSLVALGDLARAHRRRFQRPVVGITGSNGKTTTKELTALCLRAAGAVMATHANHNNRIGVPLTLARLRAGQQFAVVEMGTSEPGEIAELARIAEPTIGVLTNVAEAHLLGLGTVADVAVEKCSLLRALPDDGVAIAPADEPLLADHLAALSCRVVRFGRAAQADVRLVSDIVVDGFAQRFTVDVLGTLVDVRMPGLGVHLATNAMAALATAAVLDINLRAAAAMLGRYEPVGQRMRPRSVGSLLILEDCYNANPRSCEVALETLSTLDGPRIAVFGDMLELGPSAADLHARVGRHAADLGIDLLIAHGDHAADYVRGAQSAQSTQSVQSVIQAIAAADIDAAADAVMELAGKGSATVLVKGSRGARMERVIDNLQTRRPRRNPLEVTGVSLAL